MGQKLLVGNPIAKGVRTDRTAFGIDNNYFPVLENAYQWRGRIKRKRGTAFLCRLTSFFASNSTNWYPTPDTLTLNGAGVGEIVTAYGFVETQYTITVIVINTGNVQFTCNQNFEVGDEIIITNVVGTTQLNNNVYVVATVSATGFTINTNTTGFSPPTNPSGNVSLNIPDITLQPGSVTVISVTSGMTYIDDSNGNMLNSSMTPVGTINYASGLLTILSEAGSTINAEYNYYTGLPVMGLEDFITPNSEFPGTIGFDTTYAYNIPTAAVPSSSYTYITYYKNAPTGSYPGNVQKNRLTPFEWNGQNYQQFWTVNYEGAMFATNGIPIPFDFA